MATINYTYLGKYAPNVYHPNFDPTGLMASNLVTSETHTVNNETEPDYHVIVPLFAPFFASGLSIVYKPFNSSTTRVLVEGIDYTLAYQFVGATRGCAKPVYGGIALVNDTLSGNFTLVYQTLGGNWCVNLSAINEILANAIQNPRVTSWEQIVELPELFPVINHQWYLDDLVGASELVQAIDELSATIGDTNIAGDIEGLRIVIESKLLDLETKMHNYAANNVSALANLSTKAIMNRIDIEKLKSLLVTNNDLVLDKLDTLNLKINSNLTSIELSLKNANNLIDEVVIDFKEGDEELLSKLNISQSSTLTSLIGVNSLILNNVNDINSIKNILDRHIVNLESFKIQTNLGLTSIRNVLETLMLDSIGKVDKRIDQLNINMIFNTATLVKGLAVTNNILIKQLK